MTEEVEVVVDEFAKLRDDRGQIHMLVHCPVSYLDTLIPEGVDDSFIVLEPAEHDDEGNVTKEAVTRQKTVREFIGGERAPVWNLPDERCVFLARKSDLNGVRQNRFVETDGFDWKSYAEQVWSDYEIVSNNERLALMNSAGDSADIEEV